MKTLSTEEPVVRARRRGRKASGERSPTAAERMAQTRARRKKEGVESFMLHLGAPYLEVLEQMAIATDDSRTAVLTRLVQSALLQLIIALNTGKAMLDAGKTDDEVQAAINDILGAHMQPAVQENLVAIRKQFQRQLKGQQ
jgi:hypothetical protein